MPKVFDHEGYRFHFFSNEGDPRERVHIHVSKDGSDAKFWLWPEVAEAYNRGFDARTLAKLAEVALERRQEIMDRWNEHFA